MSCYEISAEWGYDYAYAYNMSASWGIPVGFYELHADWGVDWIEYHEIEACWSMKHLDEETHELFVEQPNMQEVDSGSGGSRSYNNFYSWGTAVTVDGNTFSHESLKSLTITQRRGNPATLDVEIWDPDFEYGPFASNADLVDVNTHRGTVVDKYWKPVIQVGGSLWQGAPNFLVMASRWKLDASGRAYVKINAVDYSQLLIEDQDAAIGDYVSTPANVYTLVEVLKDILSRYGITSTRISVPDIPLLRFSAIGGTPLDWIKSLLYYVQAEWWWEGNTFCARTPNFKGNANWEFQDYLRIGDFEYTRQRQGLFNELVVNKEEVTSAIVKEETCYGRDCLGFNNVSWETPLRSAQIFVRDVVRGEINSWVWKGKDGEIRNSTPTPALLSQDPIHQVQFIYTTSTGVVGSAAGLTWPPELIPGFKVQIVGQPYMPQGNMRLDFDENFRIRKKNSTSQARFGRKLGRTVSTTSLGRKSDVEFLVCRLLEENARKENVCAATVNVINPYVKPADIVKLKVGLAGAISGKNFVVESVTKNCLTGKMRLELSRSNDMG